jgi:4-hydroxy-2-oxoheptanedioate aldolase
MNAPTNAFRHALRNRQQIGLWSTLGSNLLTELLGGCGFDWVLIDTEHSANELPAIISQLQALKSSATSAVVRPAWSDMILVKRLLDAGAQSLLFPSIQSAAEARGAVGFTRYPPFGVRGVSGSSRAADYGHNAKYLTEADGEICVLLQIETIDGLKNLEEIATVDGVDGVFIGPADLAASLGHLGNTQHPEVQASVDKAFAQLRALGEPAGYLTTNEAEARRRVAGGVEFVAVGTDTTLFTRGAAKLLDSVTAK